MRRVIISVGAAIALIFGMVGLLWWNEGRAVQTHRSLSEGSGLVVSLSAESVDPANEGGLIHLSGLLTTQEILSDNTFQMTTEGVRLIRKVEMFQWIESSGTTRQQSGDGSSARVTTYSYAPDWSEQHHDSAEFNDAASHYNPPLLYAGESFQLESAEMGGFSMGSAVLDRLTDAEPLGVPATHAAGLQGQLVGNVSVVGNAIYLGPDPAEPLIGDHRISFEVVPLTTISVVGAQQGNAVSSYATRAGDSLLMVTEGTVTAEEMFEVAVRSNTIATWVLRGVAILLMITGFSLVMKPLADVASFIPLVGSVVRLGTRLVAGILGIALGFLVIGFAWLAYRPMVAVTIFAVGAGLIYVLRLQGERRKQAEPEELDAAAEAAITASNP